MAVKLRSCFDRMELQMINSWLFVAIFANLSHTLFRESYMTKVAVEGNLYIITALYFTYTTNKDLCFASFTKNPNNYLDHDYKMPHRGDTKSLNKCGQHQ